VIYFLSERRCFHFQPKTPPLLLLTVTAIQIFATHAPGAAAPRKADESGETGAARRFYDLQSGGDTGA
jgi:hypothetical protein